MKKLVTFVGGLLIGTGLMAQLTGQGERADKVQLNTITTAVPFLMIGPDSRAGGLGEAGFRTFAGCKPITLESILTRFWRR